MSDNVFINWVAAHQEATRETDFSWHWDTKIGESKIQKAIATSRKAQRLFRSMESTLACELTALIDTQLRLAFAKIPLTDFSNPKGFAKLENASDAQKHYYHTQDVLSYFIQQDIQRHNNRDSQLNAFRRWIIVAENLLARHNYEAYFFVIACLVSLEIDYKFGKELPEGLRTRFDQHNQLVSPQDNFSALHRYINSHKQSERCDLLPVMILSRTITDLDEKIGSQKVKTNALDGKTLFRERLLKKQAILNTIADIKKANNKTPCLPQVLQDKYHEMEKDFLYKENTPLHPKSRSARSTSESKLYNKLAPSWWKRGGSLSKNAYWEKVFSNLNSTLSRN